VSDRFEEEEEEEVFDPREDPKLRWRRISLDGHATVPSRLRANAKVNVELDSDEEAPIPPGIYWRL
jgi:hypothetical protein